MFSFLKGIKRPHAWSKSRQPTAAFALPHEEEDGDSISRGSSSSSSLSHSQVLAQHKSDATQLHDEKERASARSHKQHREDEAQSAASSSHRAGRDEKDKREKAEESHAPRSTHCCTQDDVHNNRRDNVTGKTEKQKEGGRLMVEKQPKSQPRCTSSPSSQPLQRRLRTFEENPTKASARSVKQLLARYPPAGTPAAAEEGDWQTCAGYTTPQIAINPYLPDDVAEIPVSTLPLSPRRRSSIKVDSERSHMRRQEQRPAELEDIRVSPTSQRPSYLTDDRLFMNYLHFSSPSSGDCGHAALENHRSLATALPEPEDEDTHAGSSHSARTAALHERKGTKTSRLARKTGPLPPPQPHSSPRATRSPPIKTHKKGIVVFSSSSSEDGSADETDNGSHSRDQRYSALKPVMPSKPLVDVRKAFKISPDREEQKKPQQPFSSEKQSRAPAPQNERSELFKGGEIEENRHRNGEREISSRLGKEHKPPSDDSGSESEHDATRTSSPPQQQLQSQSHSRSASLVTPLLSPSLKEQVEQPQPPHRRLRAYASSPPPRNTQVSSASDSEEIKGRRKVGNSRSRCYPTRTETPHRRTQPDLSTTTPTRGKNVCSAHTCDRNSEEEEGVADGRSNRSTVERADNGSEEDYNEKQRSQGSPQQGLNCRRPASPSLPPPSLDDAPQKAWTVIGMATNVTPHRLHHHSHEHLPRHKDAVAPSPLGTRLLHTAWASYLQHHGQPYLYENNSNDNERVFKRRTTSLVQMPVHSTSGVTAEVVQEALTYSNENNSESAECRNDVLTILPHEQRGDGGEYDLSSNPTAAAAARKALYARLQNSEKEVLLLRASLLMTYTLLVAGGEEEMMQRLVSSAGAQRWGREVDHYAGWTPVAEHWVVKAQRESTDIASTVGEDNREHDGLGSTFATARRRKQRHRQAPSPDFSPKCYSTPWPALEARLVDSIRVTAQQLDVLRPSSRDPTAVKHRALDGSDGFEAASRHLLPPPHLMLRETPTHDVKGLPSLWYPPHLSDAVGPVSGILSLWFSGGAEDSESDDVSSDASNHDKDTDAESDSDRCNTEGHLTREGSLSASPQQQQRQRSRFGFLSVLSRSSSANLRRSPQRARSAPPRRSVKKNKGSRTSASPSSSMMKGAWRRCFVIADDRGMRVYPTKSDYADFASERLLMAVPYSSLAYLIPDFVEAAAALKNGGQEGENKFYAAADRPASSSPAAVHACTIVAVDACLCNRVHKDDDASYVHFGFVHRQTVTAERCVAASAATTGAGLVRVLRSRRGPTLRFAPWRAYDNITKTSSSLSEESFPSLNAKASKQLHPPLVFRTQSRFIHAEWVHYFAYKFNRHLYRLLFPTTCAVMAEAGLHNAAVQTRVRGDLSPPLQGSEKVAPTSSHEAYERDSYEQQQQRHSHRHRRQTQHQSHSHHPRQCEDEGEDEDGKGSYHRGRSSSRRNRAKRGKQNSENVEAEKDEGDDSDQAMCDPSLSNSPSRPSAPPSPPDTSDQFSRALQHEKAKDETSKDARERTSLVQAVAQLRRALEHRDEQLRSLEAEQAALTKSLRQRERQVQELQRDQLQLQKELQGVLDRQRSVEENQQDELRRLRGVADAAMLERYGRSTPINASSVCSTKAKATAADRHHNDELAMTILEMEAAHQRESTLLQNQLEDLQRRYTADEAAWRAEKQALEARCRLTEVQVQNLRESASHQIRSLAHQVVRDLDDFHDEVTRGTEHCVKSMLQQRQHTDKSNTSRLRQLQAPPELYGGSDDENDDHYNILTAPRSPQAATSVVPATFLPSSPVPAAARAVASLLLTFQSGNGRLVDGELTVDEAEAQLLYSGPTSNQRGRRWELRHHVTDALLRIQLELLSRAPGNSHVSSKLSSLSHPQTTAVLQDPQQPSQRNSRSQSGAGTPVVRPQLSALTSSPARNTDVLTDDSCASVHHHHHHPRSNSVTQMPLSAVLRAVNVLPRDTRASRLRQAAIERQIQEREALEGA